MTKIFLSCLCLISVLLTSCVKEDEKESNRNSQSTPDGFIRVNSTIQDYSEIQPWDRKAATNRRGLGALLENKQILTTSEMVAKNVYLELESADGTEKITGKVVAIDREANLALLEPVESEKETFLDELTPLSLASPLEIGDLVETWQLENNGQPTVTKTKIHSVDVISSHALGKRFFSYLLKGSLQSASNSYTVPVIKDGELAGILTSYDSDEQISEVLTTITIKQFLKDASDGDYVGFPSLGVNGMRISNDSSREWLGLEEDQGGLYLTRIGKGSAGEKAGLEVGDVLLEMDGHALDRKGYYDDETYGKLSWTHLIRGEKGVGDTLTLKIKREGEVKSMEAVLQASSDRLIPLEFDPRGPQYLIKGGIIFQQLTRKYLQAYGKDWSSKAPLNLLDIYYNAEKYENEMEEAVLITAIIPSQLTVGYESVRNALVQKVNGVEIRKMADLEEGFSSPIDGVHRLELSESPFQLYLDAQACTQVDQALVGQGLPSLKRIHPVEEKPSAKEEEDTEEQN